MAGRIVLLLSLLGLALSGSTAEAAFPGQNGKIAFHVFGTSSSDIYTVNPDGSGAADLTSDNPDLDNEPAWSPDGRKIAFSSFRGGSLDIYVMDADGTGVTKIPNTSGGSEPAWSPDGSKIAFTADEPDIFMINVDGSGKTNLTGPDGIFNALPAWSPNGTKIAFVQNPNYPTGDFDVVTMNPNGSGRTSITTGSADDYAPNWSPDNGKLVFYRDPAVFATLEDVWRMNPDGSGQTQITTDQARNVQPAWSPDGTRVAFSKRVGGTHHIFTMSANGSGQVDVSGNLGTAFGADWQPLRRYARPKGATPVRWSLVPAYKPCTAANRQHGPPLAYGSCSPPVQESDWVTTGSDVSPPPQMQGALRFDTLVGNAATPADEADVTATLSLTDVRRKDTLADYAGEIQASVVVRITDRFNAVAAGGGPDSATVVDIPLTVDAACAATADPVLGSTCAASTSMDAVVPGMVNEGKRAIWQAQSAAVSDGGADGNVGTAPNTVFARPGVFVP